MLLAIDIGNSNIVWGLFDGQDLQGHWRLATDQHKTENEYGILFLNLLERAGYNATQIDGAIISSVVPALTTTFEEMVQTYFSRIPLIVTSDIDSGLTLHYSNPKEIGSDRIVNAAAAHARHAVGGARGGVEAARRVVFVEVHQAGAGAQREKDEARDRALHQNLPCTAMWPTPTTICAESKASSSPSSSPSSFFS